VLIWRVGIGSTLFIQPRGTDMSLLDALNSDGDTPGRRRAPPLSELGDVQDALAAFDAAKGNTAIPPGQYRATVIEGRMLLTRAGKPAYRLTLVVADGPHAGHRLWRYYTFGSPSEVNRAKAALRPLGIEGADDLRRLYPAPGSVITVKILVGTQTRPDGLPGNDVMRIEVESITATLPNPNLVDPFEHAVEGGGSQ
jgi:hypothetical protein